MRGTMPTPSVANAGQSVLVPLLPLSEGCLFPEASLALVVTTPAAVHALEIARRTGRRILAVAQRNAEAGMPTAHDLHGAQVGVASVVAAALWEVALDEEDLGAFDPWALAPPDDRPSPNRVANTPRSATAHQFWASTAHMASLRAASPVAAAEAPVGPAAGLPGPVVVSIGVAAPGDGLARPASPGLLGSLVVMEDLLWSAPGVTRVHRCLKARSAEAAWSPLVLAPSRR